jgi:hypothetical protein
MRSTFAGGVSSSVLLSWIALGCGLLLVTGCSTGPQVGELVPVEGKVLVDGTPLSEGDVVFLPVDREANGPTPNAKIQDDGNYRLATAGKPGAPLGKYRVMIKPGASTIKAKLQINPIYTKPKSPLEIEVARDKPAGDYDLHLLPPQAPER